LEDVAAAGIVVDPVAALGDDLSRRVGDYRPNRQPPSAESFEGESEAPPVWRLERPPGFVEPADL
jgi:hypothetical protein